MIGPVVQPVVQLPLTRSLDVHANGRLVGHLREAGERRLLRTIRYIVIADMLKQLS